MDKGKLKRTSRHEAGHFAMRWILGMKPTSATVSDDESGFVMSSKEETSRDNRILLAASGYAAEFINSPFWRWLPMLGQAATASDTAEDLQNLFRYCADRHKSKQLIFYKFNRAFVESFYLLRHYRTQLSVATEALYRNMHISEAEAGAMFSTWGNPGEYWPPFRLVSMRVPPPTAEEIEEDIQLMRGSPEPLPPLSCPY